MIVIDGTGLTTQQLYDIAHCRDAFQLSEAALDRVARSADFAARTAGRRPVYGRTTGVGANRDSVVTDPAAHAAALLHSHATAAGALRSRERVRAMLAVRLNQLAAGGSGVSVATVQALAAMLEQDALPEVRELGSIGTGDLPALALTALAIAGEAPTSPSFTGPHAAIGAGDALPFLSSNAASIGDAALALGELRRLARAAITVGALTFLAVDGNAEAYSPLVERTSPFAGPAEVCRRMRALTAEARVTEDAAEPARIQDPFGLRVLPQVQGALLDQLDRLDGTVRAMINSIAENPAMIPDVGVAHHGAFYAATLAQDLDSVVLAVTQSAQNSLARTTMFSSPELTGLPAFLSDGTPGASGLMIIEYVAASAVASVRNLAQPATQQTVVLSRGAEEDASFASLAARQALEVAPFYRTVIACELVAALRCARMRAVDAPLVRAVAQAVPDVRSDELRDRDLTGDVRAAELRLDDLAETTV